jgi:hypothetical protein
MDQHGSVRWAEVAEALSRNPTCPKLSGYWRFYDCRYHKGSHTCSEPAHIEACPLPRHRLRNGRLNQMAYSLFLFMRDIADADFVGWIDKQLATVDPHAPDRLAACREAVIGPLRNVYGVSDKVRSHRFRRWPRYRPRRMFTLDSTTINSNRMQITTNVCELCFALPKM